MSSLFRKKSLERISSPEQLNDYMRVSTPSVWMVLTAVVILLAGVCVWGVFGHMDTVVTSVAVSDGDRCLAYIRLEDALNVSEGMKVSVGENEGEIAFISREPVKVDAAFTEYMRHLGDFKSGEWVYEAELSVDCPDGVYTAEIVTETVSPISFVLN